MATGCTQVLASETGAEGILKIRHVRPDVRENVPELGNLLSDFDFSQAPRPPLILSPYPPTA